jgi:hypothetical protein
MDYQTYNYLQKKKQEYKKASKEEYEKGNYEKYEFYETEIEKINDLLKTY